MMPPLTFRAPRNRAEDRLWCPTIPSPPPLQDWHLEVDRGRQRLRHLLPVASDPCIALDGGAVDGWAVWAVALHTQGVLHTVAAPVPGIDTLPLTAELQALQEFIMVAMEVCPHRHWHIWCDNQTVVGMIHGLLDLGDLWRRIPISNRQWLLEHASLQWVPAHGKHPEWSPISPFSPLTLRRLNEAARRACVQSLRRVRARDIQRRSWLQEVVCAERWAQLVLDRAALCQHQLRLRYSPTELPCSFGIV